ncbi:MAG: hypothetical protein U0X75_15080 [Acidobacteriota bacterium]
MPLAIVVGPTEIAGHAITTVYWREPAQFLLSVAVTVKVNEPAAVGMPLSVPPGVSDNPVGRLPLKLNV